MAGSSSPQRRLLRVSGSGAPGVSAGQAIVEEATRRETEIIIIGAPRKEVGRRRRAVFGHTVDYVLKHAPCRVMVTATEAAA